MRASILVVDDEPDNIHVLSNLLAQQGYGVRKALSGQMALRTAQVEAPDLVLLDIQLPTMTGYEVCQKFKESEATRDIPIIFLSALDDPSDKAKAFAVGGVDYITKPFQVEEVLMRVRIQLTLHWQQQQLRAQNALLKQAEAKYRSMFENATEGIFQTTQEGRYLSANPALARILGYDSPQELMDSMTNIARQVYVEPRRREELAVYIRQFGEITEAESQVYCKDGSRIWISENMRAVYGETGEFLYYEGTVQDITDRHTMEVELRQQRQQAERLLVNILPHRIAQRLKASHHTIADQFDHVTVLFADLVDFTRTSSLVSPKELVELLNQIFSTFDRLAEKRGVEKIKTIGDAYMAAAGLPTARPDHAEAIAQLALDMQQEIQNFMTPEGQPFQLRIGINTGSVVAGVIGIKKFSYDLWGDTVNIASRMESIGEPGRIQVTATSYEFLKRHFLLEERGTTVIKGRGEMVTYWLIDNKYH